jgi:uncharacterized membrane protein YgdD (TMEM256/DUF423 family)
MRFFAMLGALLCGLAVLLGAFAAHMLKDSMSAQNLATFQTGVQYQMAHGLGLLALAAMRGKLGCEHRANVTGWFFVAGIVLFSGSLYALALSGVKALGMVAPLGGASFMIGWAVFAVNAASALKVAE